jgi:antitoxin MazE
MSSRFNSGRGHQETQPDCDSTLSTSGYNIVITMKRVQVTIRRIGNSRGVVIPKPLLAQVGLEREAEMTIEDGALVLRRLAKPIRAGWAVAAKKIAEQKDDELVMGEFSNEDDAELMW